MKVRRLSNWLIIGVAVLVLAACELRVHTDLMIEEDGSGRLSIELSVDEELAMLAGGALGGEQAIDDEMTPAGWQAEVVTGGGYEGVRAWKDFETLEDLHQIVALPALVGDFPGADLFSFLTDIAPDREDDTFTFQLVIPDDLAGLVQEEMQASPMPLDLAMLDEIFDIRLTVVLPGDLVISNANTEVGNTLVWNISLGDGGRELHAVSELPGPDRSRFFVWGAIVLAVLVAAYMIFVLLRRRRQKAEEPDPAGPTESTVDHPPDT